MTIEKINEAVARYLAACYGGGELHESHRKEVTQAFLYGIHWLNTKSAYDSDQLTDTLCVMVGMMRSRERKSE